MTARQCHKDGCDSGAEFGVNLHLVCPGPGIKQLISLRCSIEVCARHKSEEDVRGYVLSEKNRATITDSLTDKAYPEPDFFTARFEFFPIAQESIVAIPEVAKVVKCDIEECANPARFRVMQKFRSLAQNNRGPFACEALTNLNVCAKHRKLVRPRDFLDAESRKSTLEFLHKQGMVMPDVDRLVLEFVELVGGEPEARDGAPIILAP